ncbi:S-adenosyl-L-methionine-dependent methyltransferase [Agrocybe pediades]|nr:S-adenosyl-L-methionine-dependent methyltransferase [Agrocybe pediades]
MASLLLRHVSRRVRPCFVHPSHLSSFKAGLRVGQTFSTSAVTRSTQSSDPESAISKLVTLIQDAAKVIENNYAAKAATKDMKVPSLDSTMPHPLDSQVMDSNMRAAVETLEGACAQLVDTVGNPNHILMNRFMEFYYHACLSIVLTHKIPDVIHTKPEGMHTSEIEAKSGINAHKIGRVLRMLTSRHIFKEVQENVFAHNRLSIHLISSNPLSDLGQHFADEGLKSSLHLPEVLGDQDWTHSSSHTKSAFNKHTESSGTLFDHYEKDHTVGIHRGARFARGLIACAVAFESHAVVHGYPWSELGRNAVVCDLGSGIGAMSMELAKEHPNLRFILHDMPERLKQAKEEVWPQRLPSALAENRVQFIPVDLFTDPPASGCDVYYVKNIRHDWSDEVSAKVLCNVRLAMAPHSRVLVHDHILQYPFRGSDSFNNREAPQPLLANYGAGRIRQYYLDMQLLNLLNGEVRTLPHYVELGESAGLEFVKVWDLGETSAIEYCLA